MKKWIIRVLSKKTTYISLFGVLAAFNLAELTHEQQIALAAFAGGLFSYD